MKIKVLTFIAILILSMALIACGKTAGNISAEVSGSAEPAATAETVETVTADASDAGAGSAGIEILTPLTATRI